MPKTFETMFFFLLGNYDPAFDQDESPVIRILYFYSYLVIFFFLMLNMLLAIIVDSYEHVKGSLGDNVPSVWTDIFELVKQSFNIATHKTKSQDGEAYLLSHEQMVNHFDEMLHTDAVDRDIQSSLEREKDGTLPRYSRCCQIYIRDRQSCTH